MKIILADDQALIRQGLKALIELSSEAQVVALASDGNECITLLDSGIEADILLLDMRMPDKNGLDVLVHMKQNEIQLPVLILTTFEDYSILVRAIHLGASGYLLKDADLEELMAAINRVVKGEMVLQSNITRHILNQEAHPDNQLNSTEQQTLRCIVLGMNNKEIALKLNKSPGTIRNSVSQILAKLDVKDRTQAALKAIREQLV